MRPRLSRPIYRIFGQWAVTSYGVECTDTYYPIEKTRLYEDGHPLGEHPGAWFNHVREKIWCDAYDLKQALEYAVRLWPPGSKLKKRRSMSRKEKDDELRRARRIQLK